jgi:hypothetical protein
VGGIRESRFGEGSCKTLQVPYPCSFFGAYWPPAFERWTTEGAFLHLKIITGCSIGSHSERKREEERKMKKLMGLALGLLLLSGCGGYWMVTDPSTKNVYYTEDVKQSKSSGAVNFIDAKTGTSVNLQNSEVKEITKDEFKTAVGKK